MLTKTITLSSNTITSGTVGVLDKYPSVSDISFITSTTGTSPITYNFTNGSVMPYISIDESDTVRLKDIHPEWNCKSKGFTMKTSSWSCQNEIVNINVIVPKRVVEVTIFDNGEAYKYKQVCKDPDVFDLRFALALAMVKHENNRYRYRYHLTSEGVEEMADRSLRYYKEFAKEVDRAIKAYNKWLKEEEKKKLEEEERKAIIERRRVKNKKRKEKMKAKKHDEEVNTITEAIRKSKEDK